jgi:hypothetical protein
VEENGDGLFFKKLRQHLLEELMKTSKYFAS